METNERDCNHCLWATRDGGCASWNCEYVNKQDAYEAWRDAHKAWKDYMEVSEDAKKIADDMKKEGLGLYIFSAEGREEWEKRFHDKVQCQKDNG